MTTRDIATKAIQVNEEGFMTDPREWTPDIAVAIAAPFSNRLRTGL